MRQWSEVNWSRIIKVIGLLLMLEGVAIWLCLPFSLWYGGEDWQAIFFSGLLAVCVGGVLLYFTRKNRNPSIGKREGYLIVSFTWIIVSFFGALPFVLSGAIPHYTDAFFETISGFTTTGASILSDIESVPKGVLFWRSMTHFMGGMGIIVLSLAILPLLGIGGMQLFIAEVPGPVPDKLHPRITATAKRLWIIYVGLTLSETILLLFGGMSLFDALCHAFGTMATGGFSTKNDSIAGFSPYIQYVIIVFMFLAGVNFSLHYLWLNGRFRKVKGNEELRYYTFLILLMGLIISALIVVFDRTSIEESFRTALFQVVSIVTTTGYVTTDYLAWKPFIWFLLVVLMFTGGCAGSTGGGIKSIRALLLIKSSYIELKRLVHPRAYIPVRYNKKPVKPEIISNVLAFFLFYFLLFAFGSMVMSFMGMDFPTAIGSVIASLGNIGPGIGAVGPAENYALVSLPGKWFLAFLMLLGRLEIFTVLILLTPAFWKK